MHLSKFEIKQSIGAFRKKALDAYKKKNLDETLHWIELCSILGSQFNLMYEDPKIEELYLKIAHDINKPVGAYTPNPNRIVFYDEFCISYVLGIQWINALAATGKEVLYITTRPIQEDKLRAHILDRVEKYSNVEVCIIAKDSPVSIGQALFESVISFRPSQLILQMRVNSPANLMLGALPQGILRYNINLDDQTMWYGTHGIDYILEFRPFGASVSMQKRTFPKEKLLMVPFYPANDENAFQGFPKECTSNKLVIFSGGDFYKTLDDDRIYWKLISRILHRWENVVFLFASKSIPEGDKAIKEFITSEGLEGRFIHITFRPDIYQVFAHCDIYMGTSPTSGSLMSQLAAVNKKPILQYYTKGTPDDETEQAICWNAKFQISYDNEYDFMREAEQLINDKSYRDRQGKRLYDAMIKPNQFNEIVKRTLETNRTQFVIEEYDIDYNTLDNRWYYLEKAGFRKTMLYVYSLLGPMDCLKYAPCVFIKKNINRVINSFKSWINK